MTWFRNYYQQEFGDRVRNVVKGGASPTPPRPSSGSGNGRGGGVAVFLVVAVILAVLRGMSSSSGYRPPPRIEVPHFDPQPIHVPQGNWRENDRDLRQMRPKRFQLDEPRKDLIPDPPDDPFRD